MKIIITIPAYNEQDTIGVVIDDIKRVMVGLEYDYEIIVVDDGSTDDTARIVRQKGIARLIQHPYNRGYGAALKTAILHASEDTILTIDADGTFHARDIPRLLEQVGGYDMVVGSRTGKVVQAPLYRKPAKWFLTKLANYLSGARILDLNSGMRMFKKADIMKFMSLLPPGFSFTTTLTLAYLCNDYLVKYVSVDCHKGAAESKIRPLRDGLNFILLILRVITYFNPLRVFLPVAFSLLVAAVIVFIYSLLFLDDILDATVVALFIAAIQISLFGLLADAVAKKKGV